MQMLPVSELADRIFRGTDGRGAAEVPTTLTPRRFDRLVKSKFGRVLPAASTRTFNIEGCGVVVHTNGRRPSSQTVRTIKAAAAVLREVYGPCPHARVFVHLADDPAPKRLPAPREPVTVRHINSGFSQGPNVVAFRCSEMHRTIVHEMVHVWKTHSADRPAQQLFARLKLGAPKGCLLTESFVEAVTWLVHGGFCNKGLNPEHSLRVARAYLRAIDDGRTNGWAYFVGKALLVADGGARFHDAFFTGTKGTRLTDAESHRALTALMAAAHDRLGGAGLPLAPEPGDVELRLCDCSLGSAFAS
jgi:hypothetical protein